MFRSLALALASFVALASAPAGGQTLQPPFDTDYSIVDLGGVPSLPTPFGGLTFKAGDPNTILIGGAARAACTARKTPERRRKRTPAARGALAPGSSRTLCGADAIRSRARRPRGR